MLSIDYDSYRDRYPRLHAAYDALESYLKSRPLLKHIDPSRVHYVFPDLSAWELETALSILSRDGVLKPEYAVRAPDRSFARGGYYRTPDEVPQTLSSLSDERFDKSEGELVPIFTGGEGR